MNYSFETDELLRRFVRLSIIFFVTVLILKQYLKTDDHVAIIGSLMNGVLFMIVDTYYPRIKYQT
uniref:Uncharacterized protein n=1 Tax=viral metagenome TaxID=1070528 RepID=A0A6C0EAK8_9ZZZZ